MSFDGIPQEIREYNQWVVWRFEDINAAKPTKVPYNPLTGALANVNKPETWTTFDQAVQASSLDCYDGIGFVLNESDPYTFIDLDDTKGDSAALDRQIKIFNEFDSFAERSPSGTGLHIIIKGAIPSGRRRGSVEIYSSGRYMTMTGEVYRGAPINDHNELLQSLYLQMSNGNKAAAFYAGLSEAKETDEKIIEIATNAANGEKFVDLYTGRWEDHYQSQSEADFALVNIIAYYSENRGQVCRMFRASGLGKREKAKRDDYMAWMLDRCFDRMLPPVDMDFLKDRLDEVLAKRDIPTIAKLSQPELESEPANVYSVPPGLVGEIAQFLYAQAPRQVPEVALAGALAMMAGIVGRAYNVSGTGLNQYVLLLAKSGDGKEAMNRGITTLFNSITRTVPAAMEFLGPAEIASPQAIIKFMAKGPKSFLSQSGEFGLHLQQMGSKNAPPHLAGLKRFLLIAYNKSGEGDSYMPTIYSDAQKNTSIIDSPALSILGDTTPESFYESLHEGLIVEGLISRCTIIEYHGKRPPFNKQFKSIKPTFELTEKAASLCAYSLMLNSQNKVLHTEFDDAALTLFDNFDVHCDLQINNANKEVVRNLWTRGHIKAMKLAALIAIGCDPYNPTITADVANWAIGIVAADAKNLLNRFNEGEIGIDNDETKQLAKTTDAVKTYVVSAWPQVVKYVGEGFGDLHANKIIPYSYLQRKLASMAVFRKDRIGSSAAIKRSLTTLVERGDLEELSRAMLKKEYNKTCKAYMISNPRIFGI